MTGFLIFTCPICRAIVDYSCLCDEPPPIDRYEGHATVIAAKARVDELRARSEGGNKP